MHVLPKLRADPENARPPRQARALPFGASDILGESDGTDDRGEPRRQDIHLTIAPTFG